MRRERTQPYYNLDYVKTLALSGKLQISKRPFSFITNHIGPGRVGSTVRELFRAMSKDDFCKSLELEHLPKTWADVYIVNALDEDWYVKFFIQKDGSVSLRVLSANWDGYIH